MCDVKCKHTFNLVALKNVRMYAFIYLFIFYTPYKVRNVEDPDQKQLRRQLINVMQITAILNILALR